MASGTSQSTCPDISRCPECREKFSGLRKKVLNCYLHDLTDPCKEKTKQKEELGVFFRTCNAFLNDKGGLVIVCLEKNRGSIDVFDQKVSQLLEDMVPEELLFGDVFIRDYHPCQSPQHTLSVSHDHIVYRVGVPDEKAKFLMPSVLNYHTVVPVFSGKGHKITSTRFAWLLKRTQKQSPPQFKTYNLTCGEDIYERQNPGIPFLESCTNQGKLVMTKKLTEKLWKFSKDYITAFSKNREGGTIFCGVKEKGLDINVWDDVTELISCVSISTPCHNANCAFHSCPDNEPLKVWKEETKSAPQYHLSCDCQATKTKENATGLFVTEGVALMKTKKDICEDYCKTLGTIVWLGRLPPQSPVDIHFHDVGQSKFVIEIRVYPYDGVCFGSTDGPEVYECENNADLKPVPMKRDEWLKQFTKAVVEKGKPGAGDDESFWQNLTFHQPAFRVEGGDLNFRLIAQPPRSAFSLSRRGRQPRN